MDKEELGKTFKAIKEFIIDFYFKTGVIKNEEEKNLN